MTQTRPGPRHLDPKNNMADQIAGTDPVTFKSRLLLLLCGPTYKTPGGIAAIGQEHARAEVAVNAILSILDNNYPTQQKREKRL